MKFLANTPVMGLAALVALSVGAGLTGGMALAQSGPTSDVTDADGGMTAKISGDLIRLYQQQQAPSISSSLRVQPSPIQVTPLVQTAGDMVVIDAVATEDAETLLAELQALGLVNGAHFGHVVSGHLPISAIANLAAIDSLHFVHASVAMTRVGSVTSQGDRAMLSDEAREDEGVRGRRVTVGVLSDSYDCLGGAAADIASRDLPRSRRIDILLEAPCAAPGEEEVRIDEGRAMMQLIRDVAPAARQAFHTAIGGQAVFAQGILDLANVADADIIVDDIIYLAEPMFQDGIVAQAVDTVKANGVAYFSSAGNGGRNSWDSGDDGFVESNLTDGLLTHDFDPGPGDDDRQLLLLGVGTTTLILQWDEPYATVSGPPGSASALDVLIYFPPGAPTPFVDTDSSEIGGDPVDGVQLTVSNQPVFVEVSFALRGGPAPQFMKYVLFDPSGDAITDPAQSFALEYQTDSSTNYGHSNAAGAAAVGAAFWRNTPPFGVFPPEPEVFTSAGGTPIFFDTAGNRIPTEIRQKPNFTGPDGGVTTFFGNRDSFGDRTPGGNHFFGTSASAPHVAAVAALMLEANRTLEPDDIYEILEDTAIDMDDPFTDGFDRGFDLLTGYGFVDAEEAVEEAEDFEADDDDDGDDDDDDSDEFAFAD